MNVDITFTNLSYDEEDYFLTTCNMQMRNYICLKIPRWLIIFVLYMDYHFKSVTMQKHNPI